MRVKSIHVRLGANDEIVVPDDEGFPNSYVVSAHRVNAQAVELLIVSLPDEPVVEWTPEMGDVMPLEGWKFK